MIMAASSAEEIGDGWIAAIFPVASMTSVVGIALGGTALNSRTTRPDGDRRRAVDRQPRV